MAPIRFKSCGGCNRFLSSDQFHKSKHQPDGLCTQCKECASTRGKKYWKKHKVKRQADANLAQYVTDGFRCRLKSRYGITPEDYYRIFDKQGGGCYICGSTPKKRRLHVDHIHGTGQIRGLLCMSCNQGLQKFRDDVDRFKKAVKYLSKDHIKFTGVKI